jgi:hypothetical protein
MMHVCKQCIIMVNKSIENHYLRIITMILRLLLTTGPTQAKLSYLVVMMAGLGLNST